MSNKKKPFIKHGTQNTDFTIKLRLRKKKENRKRKLGLRHQFGKNKNI
jgi:hypothetical protein